MNKNVIDTINYYCKNETKSFKKSNLYKQLETSAINNNCSVKLEIGELNNRLGKKICLSLSVINNDNKIVEIYDDGYLTYSTDLVKVDLKNRILFMSWNNEDFIETIDWMTNNLV